MSEVTRAWRRVVSQAALALACSALTVPGTAHADDAGFLARVHAAGMPLTDEKALMLGRATCTDLGNGIPISAVLAANNPGFGDAAVLTSGQSWELLSAALAELCPEVRPAD